MESEKENGPGPSGTVKKSMKRKHVRTWDNFIKQICNLSEEEKMKFLKEKFTELLMENQTISTLLRNSEKHTKQLEKELEQNRAELAKNILAKSKLENIARELQKQNRDIKEESYNRLKEEEEKRREVASNFTEKLNNLTQLMNENKGKSNHLREENDNMTSKLSELYDQFQERETHLANMNKQMELQKKLSDTQLKKLEFEFEAEREIWKKERTMFLVKLQKSDDTNKVLQENVKSLQQHLDSYQKQYSDFESTMKRSNKVFDSFKEEMTKMQKANSALEKDRNEWHGRWKGSTQKLLQLTELNQAASNELKTVQKKMDALEKLCRKLQLERSYYLQRLRQHTIDLIAPGDLEYPMPSTSQLSPSFAVSEISDRSPQEPIEDKVKIENVEDEASENDCPVYPETIDCASDDSVLAVSDAVNAAGNPYDDTTSPNTDIEDYIHNVNDSARSPQYNDEDVQIVENVNDRRNGILHVQNSPSPVAENQENGEHVNAGDVSPLNVIPDSSTDHVINLNGVETDSDSSGCVRVSSGSSDSQSTIPINRPSPKEDLDNDSS